MAETVAHGEWIFDDADEYGYTYKCSCCHRSIMTRYKRLLLKSCPDCKAIMDKKTDHGTKKIPGKFPANWWFITYTNANGEADPHKPMYPAELQRIGAAVAAGAVCGIIKDKEEAREK